MKARMRLWLPGVLAFCLSAHGIIRTGYSQDSPIINRIESLKDDDSAVRAEAINALLKLGPAAIDPLINALQNRNLNVRREAVAALGRAKDLRAVNPLIEALKDEDPVVSVRAAVALKDLGDPRGVDPLIAMLQAKDSLIRCGAVVALGEFKDPRAIDPLIALLKDPNPVLRKLSGGALVKLGTAAVDPLITT
jgi:HEAT repeat protein